MKRKAVFLLVLSILMLSTLSITSTQATPVYDMLIITPTEFLEEVQPLKDFKDSTARPTIIATLEDIYLGYTGADKAEQVKRCIADYEETYERLDKKMSQAFWDVYNTQKAYFEKDKDIVMRTAAYIVSMERVAQAARTRGWV